MSKKGIGNGNRVFVIPADRDFPARIVFVGVRDSKNERLEFDHNQGLDQVSVNGVAHPTPPSLNLQAALPTWMKGIDLVLEVRMSILTEEHWPFDFVCLLLAGLDSKPKFPELRSKLAEHIVTGEPFAESTSTN
jgi:hypothetical protein